LQELPTTHFVIEDSALHSRRFVGYEILHVVLGATGDIMLQLIFEL
jgi:hypothetical protein